MEIKPITIYTGKTVPLFYDNIDTDQIIPKVHLKRVSKSGFGPFAFDEWRYLPDGSDNPDFNPNKPKYHGASILITGDNFGCGSSREHAAWAWSSFSTAIMSDDPAFAGRAGTTIFRSPQTCSISPTRYWAMLTICAARSPSAPSPAVSLKQCQ